MAMVATPSRSTVVTRERILSQSSKSGKHKVTATRKVRETCLKTFLWDNPVIKQLYRESQEKAKEQAELRRAKIKRQQSSTDERRTKLAELRRAKEAWIASKKS